MTQLERRTVLGSVLEQSPSDGETQIEEVAGLFSPGMTTSSPDARILAWLERDANRVPRREQRRIFEIQSADGRSIVSVETEA